MKIFRCQKCQNPLYFENTVCEVCKSALGYIERTATLATLVSSVTGAQTSPPYFTYMLFIADGGHYRYCTNFTHGACNWMVPADSPDEFCTACAVNRTIPDIQHPKNLKEWQKLERAKHRTIYALLRFGLPIVDKDSAPENGLAFDFLSDKNAAGNTQPIRTGYLNGLITINIAEADNVHREYMRKQMAEPYRTLIGHFRHEVGHYYWERLVRDRPEILNEFRNYFGDERADYGQALARHYANGAPKNWQQNYISAYAASHPWEDWAETWAHYLHLVDMLETAFYFGITTGGAFGENSPLKMQADFDPYKEGHFDTLLKAFVPLTYALNSLNRSMGQQDIYPFVIPRKTTEKLGFVHRLLHRSV